MSTNRARGKRRRIELVLGIKDERNVQRANERLARFLPADHPEQIRRQRAVFVRGDRLLSLPQTMACGQHRGEPGQQSFCLAKTGRVRRIVEFAVPVGQVTRPAAHDIHQRRGRRYMPQHFDDRSWYRRLAGQPLLEGLEFARLGQLAIQDQIGDLFVSRTLGQLFNSIAAIREPPLNRAYGRFTGDHPFEAWTVEVVGHSSSKSE
jgi:hypothetical protein